MKNEYELHRKDVFKEILRVKNLLKKPQLYFTAYDSNLKYDII